MEVIIKFDHNDGEEQYMDALNGWKYKLILSELMSFLRNHDKGWNSEEFNTDLVRNFIIEKLQEHEIGIG